MADKQLVQEMIADSWIQIEQFRLLVLRTAWRIDQENDYRKVEQGHRRGQSGDAEGVSRRHLAAVQLHGSLGVSKEIPFAAMVIERCTWDSPTAPPRSTRSPWRGRCLGRLSRGTNELLPDLSPDQTARGRVRRNTPTFWSKKSPSSEAGYSTANQSIGAWPFVQIAVGFGEMAAAEKTPVRRQR